MKNKNALLAVALLASGMIPAAAQPVLTYTSSSLRGPSSVPDNLLATATLTAQSGSFGQEGTGPISVLTDNLPGSGNSGAGNWDAIGSGASLTYTLDTSTNTAGYDIDALDLISGWGDFGRANVLNVTVSYELVGGTTFTTLLDGSTIANQNLAGGGSGVYEDVNYENLANGGTPLITNVAAVKFDFGSQQNGYVGYRELDVEGVPSSESPSVPEPSSGALLLFGLAGFALRSRLVRLVRNA